MLDPQSYREATRATGPAKQRARELRRELSPAERRLWAALKSKKLNGLHFRTQSPLGSYIADFYCHEARLVVEVDGSAHQFAQLDHDRERDKWMRSVGIRVIRVSASELSMNFEGVVRTIAAVARERIGVLASFRVDR